MIVDYIKLLTPLNSITYNKEEENWAFVDEIDLTPYIEKYDDVYDLMEAVNSDYSEQVKDDPSMEGNVFNWIDEWQMSVYILNKYKVRYYETTHFERL